MANIDSTLQFDLRNFGFRIINNILHDVEATPTRLTTEDQDTYSFYYYDGQSFEYEIVEVSYTDTYYFTSGTITEIFNDAFVPGEGSYHLRISGIALSAVAVSDVMRTNSAADDRALLESLLSGDDTFNGTTQLHDPFSHNFDGFGGDDDITGSAREDMLYGNTGADTIKGGSGDDQLYGGADNDTLEGGSGSDILDGGTGADRMVGGYGNDTYVVDDPDDFIVELSNGAADTVLTSIDYTLAAGVHVEKLKAADSSGTTNLDLTGNGIAQHIFGNNGNNFINGKAGSDTLTGYLGQDRFIFDTALGKNNVDRITDYNVTDDNFRLDGDIFTALKAGGLRKAAFKDLTLGPKDVSDRIILSKTGVLSYDEDGTGEIEAIQFAKINQGLAVTHDDFFIF